MKQVTGAIFFFAATIVLIGFSVAFAKHIDRWHWAVDLGLAWFVVAWAACLHAVLPFGLPESFARVREFETRGKVYRALGIKYFQTFVKWRPIHVLAPGHEYTGRKNLSKLVAETQKAEAIHASAFILMVLPVGFALLNGWYASVVRLMLLNVVLNIYPILLQRFNRARLIRLLRR